MKGAETDGSTALHIIALVLGDVALIDLITAPHHGSFQYFKSIKDYGTSSAGGILTVRHQHRRATEEGLPKCQKLSETTKSIKR